MPELKRINVLSKGIWIGLKGEINLGGQIIPNSGVGDNLLWKNAQKKEIKKKTSEVINKIIPHRNPIDTFIVWSPWNVLSRVTSRHHWIIIRITMIDPIKNKWNWKKWNHIISPSILTITPKDPKIGHGLASTRWYGWFL